MLDYGRLIFRARKSPKNHLGPKCNESRPEENAALGLVKAIARSHSLGKSEVSALEARCTTG